MSTNVWDTSVQQYHGGQQWRHLRNYKCDFSVTTNPLGLPKKGLRLFIYNVFGSLQTFETHMLEVLSMGE